MGQADAGQDVQVALVDVDETLYAKGSGPFGEVNRRIDAFVMSHLRIGPWRTRRLRRAYIRDFGSTLGGLMQHHGVDPSVYLKAVHDVPVEDLLLPDPLLYEVLSGLPWKLVAFSNGSLAYVQRVLACLGVIDLFSDIFTIEYMDFQPKPLSYPFRKVRELYGGDMGEYLIVDDRAANVHAGCTVGMQGLLVDPDGGKAQLRHIPHIYAISDFGS